MSQWERLEEWLIDHDHEEFTNRGLAQSMDISAAEASALIRSYLAAQRSPDAATLYVLKRRGRTSSSIWSVGQRTADGRLVCGILFDDVRVKIARAFEPDLNRLQAINPRARRFVEAKLTAVVEGALIVLASALDSHYEGE